MTPMGAPSPQLGDQTLNMSPMDLFDSIFWGKLLLHRVFLSANWILDPYPYGGMDQLGFDYNQPMYPQF